MDQSNVSDPDAKLDFKRIMPIFVIVLIDLMGFTIIIPLLPLYAASFGASPALIGVLGATYPIMQFLAAPILGRLSDRYGRKPILVISQIGTFVGFVLLGLATALPMIYLSRIIDGISGGNIATAQAAITDSTNEKNRTQGLGLIGAAFGLGFIIGPLITFASLALSGNDYRVPAFVAAFFSLLSILLTAFWFKETLPAEDRNKNNKQRAFSLRAMITAVSHPTVGILLILMFAQQLAFGGFEQLIALFTLSNLGLNASGNSVIFVYVGVIVVSVQGYFIGRWSRRFGDRKLIYAGLACLAIGLVLFGLTPRQPTPWYSETEITEEMSTARNTPGETSATHDIAVDLPSEADKGWGGLVWVLIAMIPISIGGGILMPAINSLITKRVAAAEVGGMLGISTSFTSAANAIAPLVGGVMFQVIGPRSPFIAGGLLMGFLLLLAVRRIKPGREETAVAGLARGGGH